MDAIGTLSAPRISLRRRGILGALVSAPLTLTFSDFVWGQASARTPSETFVIELGGKAFAALRNKALGKEALEAEFRKLYSEYFDVEPIARWIAGRSWKVALSGGRDGKLRELISEYVTKKLVIGLYDYRKASFVVTYSTRFGDVDEVLSEVRDESRGKYMNLTWLLAVKGATTFRVGDVKIGPFSFLVNERGHFDRLFSSAGSALDVFLETLSRLIAELDAMKLGG